MEHLKKTFCACAFLKFKQQSWLQMFYGTVLMLVELTVYALFASP